MAMGKRRRRARQPSMWVASSDLPRGGGHPFYERLNRVLDEAGFDAFFDRECAKFYADGVGRPSLAPGRYFRLLLLGYFEGLDSERAIAWRAADSLSLRQFLDIALHEGVAGPFDGIAHAAAGRPGDAPGGLHVGARAAGRRRPGPRQDGGHRCDDAGSQRGVAEHRPPGTRARATRRSCTGWPRRPASRHRRAPSRPAAARKEETAGSTGWQY